MPPGGFNYSIAAALELQLQKELGAGRARPVLRQGAKQTGHNDEHGDLLSSEWGLFFLFSVENGSGWIGFFAAQVLLQRGQR